MYLHIKGKRVNLEWLRANALDEATRRVLPHAHKWPADMVPLFDPVTEGGQQSPSERYERVELLKNAAASTLSQTLHLPAGEKIPVTFEYENQTVEHLLSSDEIIRGPRHYAQVESFMNRLRPSSDKRIGWSKASAILDTLSSFFRFHQRDRLFQQVASLGKQDPKASLHQVLNAWKPGTLYTKDDAAALIKASEELALDGDSELGRGMYVSRVNDIRVRAVQQKAARYPFTVSEPNASGQFIGFGAAQSIPADMAEAIERYLDQHPVDETSRRRWRDFLFVATRPESRESIDAQADRRSRVLQGMLDYVVFGWNESEKGKELTGLGTGFLSDAFYIESLLGSDADAIRTLFEEIKRRARQENTRVWANGKNLHSLGFGLTDSMFFPWVLNPSNDAPL